MTRKSRMDPKARTEAPESTYVTQGHVSDADDPELEPSENGLWAADEVARPLGGLPRSKITGRHDAGSGANETEDGLTSAEEALRRGAEDADWSTRTFSRRGSRI